jgi:UbiD family decarboxylase
MGFLDTRQWIANLEQQGELRRITAEVDWDREIGTLTRAVLGKKGPALPVREHQRL